MSEDAQEGGRRKEGTRKKKVRRKKESESVSQEGHDVGRVTADARDDVSNDEPYAGDRRVVRRLPSATALCPLLSFPGERWLHAGNVRDKMRSRCQGTRRQPWWSLRRRLTRRRPLRGQAGGMERRCQGGTTSAVVKLARQD